MARKEPQFSTEAEMCAAFVKWVEKDWAVYPETAGWDLLLSRRKDGAQIGVEAKLQLNAKVISQAVEDNPVWYGNHGPDYRAILIPADANRDLIKVCAYLGIAVVTVGRQCLGNLLPHAGSDSPDWPLSFPLARHPLPEYMPDVVAGIKSPVQLSEWKVKAIRLCLILEHRGYLTRADFKRHYVDCRRWIAPGSGWLQQGENGWLRGAALPDFKAQHPKVWEEIKADTDKWMPAA